MVLEESGIASKQSTIRSGKVLMEYILGKVSDHGIFFCEVLNKYLIDTSTKSKDQNDHALIYKFLLQNSPHGLDEIFVHFEKQFDCQFKQDGGSAALPLLEIYEKLLPKAVQKNAK